MLKSIATKLDTLGYRLNLLDELNRLNRAGRYIPAVRREIFRAPTRFDDFIEMMAFLDNSKDTLLIDVGANLGNFTKDFRQFFPTGPSVLFEPNPVCLQRLYNSAATDATIRVEPFGTGEEEGELNLRVPGDAIGLGTFHDYNQMSQEFYGKSEYKTYKVPIRRLDGFEFPKSDNTVLKIDTQGHEISVLKGATGILERVDLLILECSFAPVHTDGVATFSDCTNILNKYDLVPVIFQRFGQKISTYAFERDVIFVRRDLSHKIYHQNYKF